MRCNSRAETKKAEPKLRLFNVMIVSRLGLDAPRSIRLAAGRAGRRLIALVINENRLLVVAAINRLWLAVGRAVGRGGLLRRIVRLLINRRRRDDISVHTRLWVLPANGLINRCACQCLLRCLLRQLLVALTKTVADGTARKAAEDRTSDDRRRPSTSFTDLRSGETASNSAEQSANRDARVLLAGSARVFHATSEAKRRDHGGESGFLKSLGHHNSNSVHCDFGRDFCCPTRTDDIAALRYDLGAYEGNSA